MWWWEPYTPGNTTQYRCRKITTWLRYSFLCPISISLQVWVDILLFVDVAEIWKGLSKMDCYDSLCSVEVNWKNIFLAHLVQITEPWMCNLAVNEVKHYWCCALRLSCKRCSLMCCMYSHQCQFKTIKNAWLLISWDIDFSRSPLGVDQVRWQMVSVFKYIAAKTLWTLGEEHSSLTLFYFPNLIISHCVSDKCAV